MRQVRRSGRESESDQRREGASAHVQAPPTNPLLGLQTTIGNQAVQRLVEDAGAPSSTAPPATSSAAMGEGGQTWLRPGDSGPAVANVRRILNTVGTAGTPLPEGDRYDQEMIAVLQRFQTDQGLDPDSIIGPLTWEALDRHSATTAEVVDVGTDHISSADRPTDSELGEINTALNPTSTGPTGQAEDWDGRNDQAARAELRTELHTALQAHLDDRHDRMVAREQAKAAGQVLTTANQEGAGRAAKRSVDDVFAGLASAAVLTASQEQARASFNFTADVNLLDASDTSVRQPKARDLVDWMAETDDDASQAQSDHHFNRRRRGQGERPFFHALITEFIGQGSNRTDLDRYDQFGFAFAEAGPRVLSQTAITDSENFSATPDQPGGMSDAERLMRWGTWETLVHEYIHTLAHPEFNRSHGGNRILVEGFCELFTKAVLDTTGAIGAAQSDADPTLRHEIEGGDVPEFEARFVPDFDPGSYANYLARAEAIVAQVGMDAARSAFFLGHVELIGLEPGGDGEVIDPASPDASRHRGPERVVVPETISTVNGVSILTGASVADISSANAGISANGPLPPEAHTAGLNVPGTKHHRVLAARSRTQRATESKQDIATQHGITVAALVRANPNLNHREPREAEWLLIPVH
jgi:peptidoglycan hydrolase-like protein with peptidoglycan-binding domain